VAAKLNPAWNPARTPLFLPDGNHFLFAVDGAAPGNSGIFLGALDSFEKIRLLPDGYSPEYSDSGYVLFLRGGALMAQPFDANSLRVTGEAVPVASPVGSFSVAGSTLVYQPGGSEREARLRWYDRHATVLGDAGPPGDYGGPEVSPDGRRIATSRGFRAATFGYTT
jgi:eukaryotic-like serine/threonine-protein kinase